MSAEKLGRKFGNWNDRTSARTPVTAPAGSGGVFCHCVVGTHAAQTLEAELGELERTDPDVRAAAESYDRMVERITGRELPRRDV